MIREVSKVDRERMASVLIRKMNERIRTQRRGAREVGRENVRRAQRTGSSTTIAE